MNKTETWGSLRIYFPRGARIWHLHIARSPKCSPQSAQRPSALQSASINNPPCNIASGVRSFNCAGPGMASKSVSYTHLTLPTICSV
eukprot:7020794-Alexandrium_andersonii.AAC.1